MKSCQICHDNCWGYKIFMGKIMCKPCHENITNAFSFCESHQIMWDEDDYSECPLCQINERLMGQIDTHEEKLLKEKDDRRTNPVTYVTRKPSHHTMAKEMLKQEGR